MRSVLIVGGGITGLVSALVLSQNGHEVTLLEKSPKIGGLLACFDVGQTKLECFYHHFFTHDLEILWLLKELGIEQHVKFFNSTMGVYHQNHLYPFNGPGDLLRFKPFSLLSKIRFALSSLYLSHRAQWIKHEHVSCANWFRKYAGDEVLQKLWGPLLKIKFAHKADQIPLSWMIGRLSQRVRSRNKTQEKLGYLMGGLDVLVQALLKRLTQNHVHIHLEQDIKKINVHGNTIESLETSGQTFKADRFIFTTPTHVLGQLFRSILPSYSSQLDQIEYIHATCMIVESQKALSNIYWTNVTDSHYGYGGVIEHTNLIAPSFYNQRHLTYLSRYHLKDEAFSKLNPNQIKDQWLKDLLTMFPHIRSEDILDTHLFQTKTAATLCDLGFSKKVPKVKGPLHNMFVINMAHIYPDERSVNNSISTVRELMRVMQVRTSIPKGRSLSGNIGF